jgi:hypothetical protein
MNWIRVSGPLCINLDRVNMVKFEPSTEICTITWATGDAPLELQGVEACAFMAALDKFPFAEADGFWFGNPCNDEDEPDDEYQEMLYQAAVLHEPPDESV